VGETPPPFPSNPSGSVSGFGVGETPPPFPSNPGSGVSTLGLANAAPLPGTPRGLGGDGISGSQSHPWVGKTPPRATPGGPGLNP
jgi:hypothetical protein